MTKPERTNRRNPDTWTKLKKLGDRGVSAVRRVLDAHLNTDSGDKRVVAEVTLLAEEVSNEIVEILWDSVTHASIDDAEISTRQAAMDFQSCIRSAALMVEPAGSGRSEAIENGVVKCIKALIGNLGHSEDRVKKVAAGITGIWEALGGDSGTLYPAVIRALFSPRADRGRLKSWLGFIAAMLASGAAGGAVAAAISHKVAAAGRAEREGAASQEISKVRESVDELKEVVGNADIKHLNRRVKHMEKESPWEVKKDAWDKLEQGTRGAKNAADAIGVLASVYQWSRVITEIFSPRR